MSAKVDQQRAKDSREDGVKRGRALHYKLGRILDMYEDGLGDAAIGKALGWDARTVMRYRKVLQLMLGKPSGGRWSTP